MVVLVMKLRRINLDVPKKIIERATDSQGYKFTYSDFTKFL